MRKTPLKNKKGTTLRTKSNLKRKTAPKRTGLRRKPRPDGLPHKSYTYKTKTGRTKKMVNSYWKAVYKTDRLFSLLRRLQEADEHGVVTCFTSGVRGPWKYGKIELGHFRSRGNMNTRWDPMNGWPQTEYDNRVLKGNLEVYRKNLVKRFGEKEVKALEKRADATKKWTLLEMSELRRTFAKQIKELKAQKGL